MLHRLTAALLFLCGFSVDAQSLHFAIIGDRTGEHVEGIYEQVWKQVAAENPAFALSVGDTIEGEHDRSAESEWKDILGRLPSLPFYLTPGNHDIWSPASEDLYRKYSRHDLHYSFDAGPAHFTILDNSRSDELSPAELSFLEDDLKAHAAKRVKLIVSHRPSWLIPAMLGSTEFPLHRLAKKYGVQYVIAGHLHELLHAELDGVHYVSMPSAGGHLRASGKYEDGWFFGYATVNVSPTGDSFKIHALEGKTTDLGAWGKAGLR